jgi:hypothetical protein
MSETVTYLGVTITKNIDPAGSAEPVYTFTYRGKEYKTVEEIPRIADKVKDIIRAKHDEMEKEDKKMQVDQDKKQKRNQNDQNQPPKKPKREPIIAETLSSQVTPSIQGFTVNSTDQDVCFLMKNNLHDMLHDFREASNDRIKGVFYNIPLNLVSTEINNLFGGYLGTAVDSRTISTPGLDTVYEPVGLDIHDNIEQSLRPFLDEEYSNLVSNFFLHLYDDNNVTFDIKNINKELFLYENNVEDIAPYNVFVEKVYDFIERRINEKTYVSLSVLINDLYKLNSRDVINDLTDLFVHTGGYDEAVNKEERQVTNKFVRIVASEFDTWFCSECETENTYNHFLSAQDDILQQSISGEGPASNKSNADISIYKAVREIMCSNVIKRYEESNEDIQDIPRINNYVTEVKNNSKKKFIIDNSAKKFPFKDNKDHFAKKDAIDFAIKNTMCIQSTADDGITANFSLGHPCAGIINGVEKTNGSMNIIFQSQKRSVQYIRDATHKKWCIIWKKNATANQQEVLWGAMLTIETNELSANLRLRACVKELANLIDTSTFNTLTPKDKKRQIAITAYSQLSFKLLGDLLQEIDGTFKKGGRVNAPTYPGGVTGVEAFDTNGNAKRLVISTDQPSAARLMWIFYNGNNFGSQCKGQSSDWSEYLNTQSRGGYYNHITYVIEREPKILGTAKCQYFIYDPIDGIVAHREKNTLVPHKRKLNVGRLFTNIITFNVNNKHIINHMKHLIQRYTFYSDNQCYEADDNNKIINMPDFLNSLSYVESEIIELPHPVLLNILNEKLLTGQMQVNNIGNIIYDPTKYGITQGDCTKDFIQSTTYGYNNLQTEFDVINIIPQNSRITFKYRKGTGELLLIPPIDIDDINVRKDIAKRVFDISSSCNPTSNAETINNKQLILNTQYFLYNRNDICNRILPRLIDQFLLDINTDVNVQRLEDVNNTQTECIDECTNTTNVTPVQVNTTPSGPVVTCKFKNQKYKVTIDNNEKEFDTKPTSAKGSPFHTWVNDLYPIDNQLRQSIYMSIHSACPSAASGGANRRHPTKKTGGASSNGQEQKDEDNSAAYGAIAIGLIIGLFTGFKV